MSEQKSQIEKLRAKVVLVNAHNALMRGEHSKRQLEMLNGMSGLLQAAQFRQDNITSLQPLISSNQYAALTLNYNTLIYSYSTHPIIQTAIDQPVMDAHADPIILRCSTLSPRNLEELEQWMEENNVEEPRRDAETWGRLFGGSALVVNVAGDPRKPLDLTNPASLRELERGRFSLYPAARWELGGTWRFSDTYNFYGMDFDKSRVFTFIGKRMPWILERQLSGWGASLIARMSEDFNLYLRTRNVLYELLEDAKTDVYKMNGYNAQLLTAEGTSQVDQRIMMSNQLKNYHKALVLDAEDDYQQKQVNFTGIADVQEQNRLGICCATRMPYAKLFGTTSGSGGKLGNSGQDDMENYNGMLKAEVRRPARPIQKQLLAMGAAALFGAKHHVDFEYPPLREMDAKTEEEVKTSKQARVLGQLEEELISLPEAAAWCHKEKLTPIETLLGKRGGPKIPDVKRTAAKAGEKGKSQGADHAKRKGTGVAGDGRQAPHYG